MPNPMNESKCHECGGRGFIELFTSTQPCTACRPGTADQYRNKETTNPHDSHYATILKNAETRQRAKAKKYGVRWTPPVGPCGGGLHCTCDKCNKRDCRPPHLRKARKAKVSEHFRDEHCEPDTRSFRDMLRDAHKEVQESDDPDNALIGGKTVADALKQFFAEEARNPFGEPEMVRPGVFTTPLLSPPPEGRAE